MSEPTTAAGRALPAALREHAPWFLGGSREAEIAYITAIEAEAITADRERIEAEIATLVMWSSSKGPLLAKAAVLRIVNPEEDR